MNTTKTILAVFAHPDDETFAAGGTIAKYARAGWKIHLITATKGEAGRSVDDEHISKQTLSIIREQELSQACKILGVASIHQLSYRDKKLRTYQPGEIEDKVYKVMLEVSPDIVLTFEPKGISNHPDHIKISRSTTFAFQKYAKGIIIERGVVIDEYTRISPRQLKLHEALSKAHDPKLYYACMPASVAGYLKKKKIIPEMSYDRPWAGTPDGRITTVIDIKRFTKKKLQAVQAHATQKKDWAKFVAHEGHPLLFQEFFILRMHGIDEVFMGKHDVVSNRL